MAAGEGREECLFACGGREKTFTKEKNRSGERKDPMSSCPVSGEEKTILKKRNASYAHAGEKKGTRDRRSAKKKEETLPGGPLSGKEISSADGGVGGFRARDLRDFRRNEEAGGKKE